MPKRNASICIDGARVINQQQGFSSGGFRLLKGKWSLLFLVYEHFFISCVKSARLGTAVARIEIRMERKLGSEEQLRRRRWRAGMLWAIDG